MYIDIKTIAVGTWKVNCYLVALGNEGWIIDPGDEAENIIHFLNLDNYKLKGIINTHGHFDHVGAVSEIKEKYNIPFFIHSKDKRLISHGNLYRGFSGDSSIKKTPIIDDYLDTFPFIKIKDKKIMIYHTPGHTPGSVCYEIDGNLITGDLFFKDKIGRTDLPGSNTKLILTSIKYIFENFRGFLIRPGHGESFLLNESIIDEIMFKKDGFNN